MQPCLVAIISAYKEDYSDQDKNPVIDDPSEEIIGNDLLSDYSTDDFSAFIDKLDEHACLLNTEGTSNTIWRKILGTQFPNTSQESNALTSSNLLMCINAPHRQRPYWPMQRGGAAFIAAHVTNPAGIAIEYANNGAPLEKNCSLHFRAITGIKPPYTVKWQIVNTGYEAQTAGCLRGYFEDSNDGPNGKRESTSYTGSHSVQCFVIKRGICVARSKEFIVNIL